jgi:simple sugar transport system permease protein
VGGTQITWGIILALAVSVLTIAVVVSTTTGLRLRAIGLNGDAARHAGLPVERYWLHSMTLSGAVCGLAGGLVLLGLRYYIAPGWASPWGFQGILIAFLALRSPYLIPVWGILFGMLASAGPALKGDASVPDSIVTIMQTLPVIVLFLLYAAGRWLRGGRSRGAILKPGQQPAVET